jgi:hypothetical protein
MVTVRDETRVIRTAGRLTAVPGFPLGGDPRFHPVWVLPHGTANLEEGHGELRYPA